jgi:hypothetical protein
MISMAEGTPVSSTAVYLSPWYALFCIRSMFTNDITAESQAIFMFCGSIKDEDYNPTLFWVGCEIWCLTLWEQSAEENMSIEGRED